jgi:universal stress protein A
MRNGTPRFSASSEKLTADLKEFAVGELDGIDCEVAVMTGDPTTAILERAGSSEADVICMATHGWTGLRHILLGSVAEKVVRGAQCPTLTVRLSPETLRD